jgi:pre-mRNA-processing factor 19
VISKRTGLLFEKRLIEKHLEVSKSCPVTGAEMCADDLLEIKGNIDIINGNKN